MPSPIRCPRPGCGREFAGGRPEPNECCPSCGHPLVAADAAAPDPNPDSAPEGAAVTRTLDGAAPPPAGPAADSAAARAPTLGLPPEAGSPTDPQAPPT